MNIYYVGGCVRDILLKRTPKDIDYVVVGSTPQEMLASGFAQVGANFPVFLKDGSEYALARTEKKTGVGYSEFETNFSPSITLFEDLKRRDLTINSMAVSQEHWEIFTKTRDESYVIDPFGGLYDLSTCLLKHTSEAFSEDPIRVLRTARFAARYQFQVHPTTLNLMCDVVPELNYVSPDRIWAEFAKGLMEDNPVIMIETLEEVGAFKISKLQAYTSQSHDYYEVLNILNDYSVIKDLSLRERFALLPTTFSAIEFETYRIPLTCAKLSSALSTFGEFVVKFDMLPPIFQHNLLSNLRVHSSDNKQWLMELVKVSGLVFDPQSLYNKYSFWEGVEKFNSVDAAAIASQGGTGEQIKQLIQQARLTALTTI